MNNPNFIVNGTSASTTWHDGGTGQIHVVYHQTENSEIGIEEEKVYNPVTRQTEISPKLYFSYVKSKLNKVQQKKLLKRIEKLYKLVEQAKEIDQDAAKEEYAKLLAIAVREQEAYACGIQRYVDKDIVDKFKNKVKDRVIKWSPLEEFPRVIPKEVRNIIKQVKKRDLFDKYYVLYTDYTDEDLKTTKDKIIEKDPILFGEYSYQEGRLYFIADWIDEYCDLTIEKFVEEVKDKDIGDEDSFKKIPELDEKYFQAIKEEVQKRHETLRSTNSSNWRTKALDEERKKQKEKEKPWWKFW